MSNSQAGWSGSQSSLALRAGAGAAVLALHAAVAGALLFWAPPTPPEISEPEAVMVRFVEIGPEPQEAQAQPTEAPPAPEIPPEPPEPPEPEIEPEPEPEITPPEPEPEIEPEPEPLPEPPPMPEPPKPKPKPKPKPQPKPQPKPEPRPEPKPQPPAPAEQTSGNPQADSAPPKGPTDPPPPDQPRLIGRVDYLGKRPMPVYPRASQMRREQGRVVVRVLISTEGEVDRATVQVSSGYERLDESALDAARKARFKPYTENGIPYPAMADLPFDFVLRN